MAFVIADRVKETTTTAGNGTITLAGASLGYQSFAAVGNGNTTYYCIAGQTTSEWEVGIGTYTSSGTTLSRDTVLSSSDSGNKVVFSAGTKDVFVTYPSQRAVTTDTTQTLTNKTLSSGSDWNGNAVAVTYGGTGTTTFSSNIIPYFDGSTFNSTNVYFFSNLVGVNISSPGAQLDVQASTGTPLRFATAYADVSAVWGQRIGSSTTEKYRISWDYLNGGFYFYDISNSAERMRIDSSGNVGIGTNAPAVKFDVIGSVKAQAAATQDAVLLAGRAGGTSSYAVTLTPATLSSSTTLTLPNVTDTVATIGTAQTFTAAQTFRAANAIRSEAASTQDAIVIAGRAGGTSSYASTLTPATLSANRTVTIPDETFTVGFRNIPAVGTKTSSYTLAVGDVGKYVQVGTSGSIIIPNATFAEGDVISIFNNTTGTITITCSITTAYIAGTDSDKATMTLATRGVATVLFISSTVCVVSGNVS